MWHKSGKSGCYDLSYADLKGINGNSIQGRVKVKNLLAILAYPPIGIGNDPY